MLCTHYSSSRAHTIRFRRRRQRIPSLAPGPAHSATIYTKTMAPTEGARLTRGRFMILLREVSHARACAHVLGLWGAVIIVRERVRHPTKQHRIKHKKHTLWKPHHDDDGGPDKLDYRSTRRINSCMHTHLAAVHVGFCETGTGLSVACAPVSPPPPPPPPHSCSIAPPPSRVCRIRNS